MKYIALVACFFTVAAAHAFSLSGTVNGVKDGKVYLQRFNNKMFTTIDSAVIENGRFTFKTKPVLPELYGITLNPSRSPYFLFLEDSNIEVALDTARYFRNTKVTGSSAQDVYNNWQQHSDVKLDELIKANPASLATAYIFYRYYTYRTTPEEIERGISLLDPSLQQTQYVNVLKQLPTTLRSVEVGKKAPDFVIADTEGRQVHFKDQLGKKYVLLDFWASWCGPCRAENPNLVRTYQQFKDKGFDIFAVSLDRNGDRDKWLKAIADDQLTWQHVSDLAFWNCEPAALYGVRAIPSNLLIAPDGTILARNLRGKELEAKLGELLK
ncbi:AhpC/TSA family protein [Chitinophaga horti]|uniref:AhpC/TSA family protein n=1 Tax=Chitinophaga horti TaxID=2920382 RepID=A0ABY6J9B4_9BACT|nr:TlpA disulfide reductase family protein [Chitinophaga horti]UYQ94889.1 AhpC/TSA family protein [Chitinophaga horti]